MHKFSNQKLYAAVFLDKDGTLVDDVPYNVDPALIRLAPGASEGLPLLRAAGFRLVVVSNQSGVARGLFPESALKAVEKKISELMSEQCGVELDSFFYCPHHPGGCVDLYSYDCDCRKPEPGMLRRASHELNLDLAQSWMVGDILDDVEAGRRAGCRTVLIDNGNETEWVLNPGRTPHHRTADLVEAARIITGAPSPVVRHSTPTGALP